MIKNRDRIYEELIVLKCQEGDISAFDELVSRYQKRLWKHALYLTNCEDAAWDIVQEAWMGIIKGMSKLQDPAAFSSWAYRIVSNKCNDWIRKQIRQRNLYDDYMEESRTIPDDLEEYNSLKEAFKKLPGDFRAIISLKYLEGFDVNEISEILGIPVGTVKSRLFHARDKLKKVMESDTNG